MKIRPADGGATIVFDDGEVDALMALLVEQSGELAQLEPGDARWDRLHPAAFEDPQAAQDFRGMVDADLDVLRSDRIGTCLGELAQASTSDAGRSSHEGRRSLGRRGRTRLRLDADAVQRWIAAVNDLRLMQGTALGVTADNAGSWRPDSPDFAQWMAYHWLTGIQDALVNVAMG